MTRSLAALSTAPLGGAVLVVALAACVSPLAPSTGPVTSASAPLPLRALTGPWAGTLTYADYSDDTSRTTLTLAAEAEAVPDGVRITVSFVEPDGSSGGTDVLTSTHRDGTADPLMYDETAWAVLSRQVAGDDAFSVVFSAEGRDNNQAATIRHTLALAEGVLTDRKEVRYAGSDEFFERTAIRLTRR